MRPHVDPTAWGIGPVTLSGRDWPAAWNRFADVSFRSSVPSEQHVCVEYRPQAARTCEGSVQLRVLEAGGLDFSGMGSTQGQFSTVDHTLRLACDPALAATPQLTLENALRVFLAARLPLALDGLMLHAASGILEGQGVLFAGISTAGKSTLANAFSAVHYLSDDISLIDRIGSAPRLLSSPFFGSAGRLGAPAAAPVRALAILEQSTGPTTMEKLYRATAMASLLRHVVVFGNDAALLEAALARVADLVERVPVFRVARSLSDPSDAVFRKVLREVST